MEKLHFNVKEYKIDQKKYKILSPGFYIGEIESYEFKIPRRAQINKTNDKFIELVWKIIEKPDNVIHIIDRLNLYNSNPTLEKIARNRLACLCDATKVDELEFSSDFDKLLNIPVELEVIIKSSEFYGKKNIIKRYLALNDKGIKQ